MLSTHRFAAIVAAAVLLVFHATATVAAPRQVAEAAPGAATSAPGRLSSGDYVEARIKALHDELKITPAEEPQWSAVAAAMRDNAKSTGALIAERAKKTKSMSAVENLRTYEAIAKAHLDGIEKLLPAFEALYAVMPEAQKKNADLVFNRRPTRPRASKSQ
jgi:periplasmic protein CpxP/Spy